ncbi:MAG TPA: aldehyde dehydrogenase family protein, partial [candidate division Zixibacteria bacterium]|nr:aldehyde dehydrogenase family protein [candidate division Zixibacteria bacterium]
MPDKFGIYLGGKWVERKETTKVVSPYDGKVVGEVAMATKADFTKAIEIADKTFALTRELPSYVREGACKAIADGLKKSFDKFSKTMSLEVGKAIRDSEIEVNRAIQVFTIAAEEAKRIGGEIMDLDWIPGNEKRMGLIRRFPIGVIAGISPFNFPLNLVAHKVAPAMASGNCMVLKPAPKTPLMAMMLAELIDKTEYPKGAVSVMLGSNENLEPLIKDERVKLITFTGSDKVGWMIKEKAGKKKVVLELGGNAGVIVADDAELDYATDRIVKGAFGQAGQSCISVQRIFVQQDFYEKFMKMFVEKTKKLKIGDPLDRKTDIGTMVSELAVKNTAEMVNQAKKEGAKIHTGGTADGGFYQPTIITNVKSTMDVCSKEAFAPIATVEKYKTFEQAVEKINDSEFGLQAGVFTNRLKDVFYAFNHIDAGGIVVNDVPTFRADQQPYGGVKNSGLGREGIRFTIEDMTELKILSMNLK